MKNSFSGMSPERRKLLSQLLDQEQLHSEYHELIRPRKDPGEPVPLSYAQQRLWFLQQLEPGNALYNVPLALRLTGKLKLSLIQRALDEIIRRHQILRTTFDVASGVPCQILHPPFSLEVPIIDVQANTREEREHKAKRLAAEEARKPFDLLHGPLVRAIVLRLGDTEHFLALVIHHIVSDRWSLGVIIRELAILYEAFDRGQQSPLPELEIQYSDYVLWQRASLSGTVLTGQLEYWKRQLQDLPDLELPAAHPRHFVRTHAGAVHSFLISGHVLEQLHEVSRQYDVTLFMTLLGIFKVLLSRYGGAYDVVAGTPISGRSRTELEPLIGFFLNMLVLRTDLSGNPGFGELLARIKATAIDAYAHQDVPFEMLVQELQPDRNVNHTPLFRVLFMVHQGLRQKVNFSELDIQGEVIDADTAKFDLTLFFNERQGEVRAGFSYSTELFDPVTIQRMTDHLQRLLHSAIRNPRISIGDLPLLSDAERQQMIFKRKQAEQDRLQYQSMSDLVSDQVKRTPDTDAVIFGDQRLSYQELNTRSNQLAHYLKKHGAGPETRVGICLHRSVEMIVSIMGVVKAGGAYVPFDPSYPPERLHYMAEDADIRLLVSQPGLWPFQDEHAFQVICPGTQGGQLDVYPKHDPEPRTCPENLAYIIYTSGSTGRPKGVEISHAGLMNLVSWHKTVYKTSHKDHGALIASAGFDASAWELWSNLTSGATLHIPDEETRTTPKRLHQWLVDQGITVAFLPTPLAEAMLEAKPTSTGNLRFLLTGGDTLHRRPHPEFSCVLVNHYGPTEGSVVTTSAAVEVSGERLPSIGKPLPNVQVYVLDDRMELLPVWGVGEVYIGGAGLARGYSGRPNLTAERFVPNPFSKEPGTRLYRSGDRARWLPNGELEFLGRFDNQIKLRGYRIELGEIEAAILSTPDIAETAVLVREFAGEKHLVAYLVHTNHAAPDTVELRKALKTKLPPYMVPAHFVILDKMPLTASGKINRQVLSTTELDLKRTYDPPQTPEEEIIAGIWARALGVNQVGREDNFFELGGHSLLATRVVNQIRESLKVDVGLREFFAMPTPRGLAEQVNTVRLTACGAVPSEIKHVPPGTSIPLSYAQQRLLFLAYFDQEPSLYNICVAYRLKGELNDKALESSLKAIVKRHETLRTHFSGNGTELRQIVRPWEEFRLTRVAPDAGEMKNPRSFMKKFLAEELKRPMNLSAGPLFRVSVVKVGEEEHVLVVVMHHIISDGWSLGILKRELRELYGGYSRGGEVKLEELPIQYGDYAVWQREWLAGGVLEKQLEYWRKQLEGVPEVLELTISKGRGAVQGHEGGRWRFELGKEQVNGLKELSQQQGVTLFMVVLCGFQIVLERYSGQKDVVVGSPVAGRNRREVEGLIGFFVNTLVLRGEVRGEKKVGEMLQEIREMTLEAYSNQDVPFEKLVEELQPERDMSRSPLFQVMLVLQNAPEEKWELGGMEVEPEEVEGGFAKFDLTLQMKETAGGGMQGVLAYRRELMEEEGVKGIGRHLQVVLGEMVKKPESRIGELEMLEEEERRQVVEEWNRTGVRYEEGERSLQELFEEQVRRTPGGVAVGWRGEEISYEELNRRANRVGHYLRKQGVKAESRVGLCMERGIGLVVGVLGVLKAGGAYVPLDASYPAERLRYMAEDAEIEVLLTERKGAMGEKLKEIGSGMVCVELDGEQEWEEMRGEWEENPGVEVSGENAVYVIYTSGSTGKPKGVVMEQRNAVELVRWGRRWYREEELRCVLFSTSVSFDLSVFEMFVPLSVGGRVEVVENALELVERRGGEGGVTLINTVPSAMVELVRMKAIPESVRVVNLAGEALERGLVEQIYKEGAGVERVVNLYGPTEDTTYSTFLTVERGGEGGVGIGVAISNGEAYVLDEEQRVQPVGVAGEIYLGGGGVARGYLKRAELTAERFVPDGVGRRAGGRLYRTGDRGRWRRDGKLEYLGRADQQVKVRGYRIELGEIETVLKKVEGVEQGVVVVRGEEEGQKRLVGYVVWKEGSRKTGVEQLKERLRRELPEYMVPAVVVELQEMPLSANGKIARNRLPEPGGARLAGEKVYRGPRNELEEVLAGIWAEVLHVERVGIDDNFFALGGHSLLAMRLVSKIRTLLRIELPLRAIFEAPSVTALVRLLNETKTNSLPLIPKARPERLPLSYAQQRLWFLHQFESDKTIYNIPLILRIHGSLRTEVLEHAINQIITRHEILRTRYTLIDGYPVQEVCTPQPLRIHVVDARDLPEEELQHLISNEAHSLINLENVGPLRMVLFHADADSHVLVIIVHHIACDGWSIGILTKELATLYRDFSEEHDSTLPALPLQYADYTLWQNELLQGGMLERQLGYWRDRLLGMPDALSLPTDQPRRTVATRNAGVCSFAVSDTFTSALRNIAQGENATLFMVLLGVLQLLLSRYSGQDDLSVGTPIAGRNYEETEKLIGLFVNTLVLRTDLSGDPDFHELLGRVRETALGAYTHQDLPFEKLVEELQPVRDLLRTPLFQVMLALQNTPRQQWSLAGLNLTAETVETRNTKFDLVFSFVESGYGLHGSIIYSSDLFDRATALRIAKHMQVLLESVAQSPERPGSELNLLSGEELQQIVVDWNRTEKNWQTSGCIHELIEAQAARTPEAEALSFEDQHISYAALNAQSNRLGHYLRTHGVGPEVLVGVCLHRSVWMAVSLLGILKAGAAYVPLDPTYPPDRLRFLLEDAQTGVLITEQELIRDLPTTPKVTLCLAQLWPEIETYSPENLRPTATLDNLAYVIYTSGSTGKPKGAMNTHRAIVNRLLWMQSAYGLHTDDSVLQKTSFSFDVSVWEFFWPLLTGARLVIARPEGHRDPAYLISLICSERVTVLHFVPSMLAQFLREPGVEKCGSLKTVICSGEALAAELVTAFYERIGATLHNLYGPTEAAVDVTSWECAREARTGTVLLGRPIDNVRIHILNNHIEPVPAGVAGELFIGGIALGRGYLSRPELTAEKFIPNPFSKDGGERLYRTGDIARYTADGEIEYLGRADQQVKIRGYRIEIEEIEAALAECACVQDAIVVAYEPSSEDKRLIAYVVPRNRCFVPAENYYHLPNGMYVAQLNKNETDYLYEEIFTAQEYLRSGIQLAADSCIVDAGANIGMFTLFAAEHCPQGEIYALEPIAPVYEKLQANASRCPGRVSAIHAALGKEDKLEQFTYYPHSTIMSGLQTYADTEQELGVVKKYLGNTSAEKPEAAELLGHADELLAWRFTGETQTCEVRRLSTVIAENGIRHIDLLKIDVERAELDVLHGIDDDDWLKIEQIVVEAHDTVGAAETDRVVKITGLLEKHGFHVEVEKSRSLQNTGLYNVYATRARNAVNGKPPVPSAAGSNGSSGGSVAPSALRLYLHGKLPDYMVPAAIVLIERLPLTPSGKADRKALKSRAIPQHDYQRNYVAPRTPTEELAARIWEEVLSLEKVGTEDNFFELGGHSLLAMRMVNRVNVALGVNISLRVIFEAPALAAFVARLHQAHTATEQPLTHEPNRERLPLSFAQQRLWFLSQFDSDKSLFNIPLVVRMAGLLKPDILKNAISEVVRRHEVLRTRFPVVDGDPIQAVQPEGSCELSVIDLQGQDEAGSELEIKKQLQWQVRSGFDLMQGPLIRAVLLRVKADEYVFVVVMHHIVSDGWSMGIFASEVAAIYEAFAQGRKSPLAELPIQYGDYARWQRRVLEDTTLQTQLDYWRHQLADMPEVLDLPADRPRPPRLTHNGGVHYFQLSHTLFKRMLQISRTEGATLFMLLLAGFQALLCRYTGQEDLAVGTPIAGRNRTETEKLIGLFVNTLVMRAQFAKHTSFLKLVAQVRESTLAAYAHQDLPFERLVEELEPQRDLSRTPLFQVMFMFQNMPRMPWTLPGISVTPEKINTATANFDLTLAFVEDGKSLSGTFGYNSDLFDAGTISRMARHFCALLEGIVLSPDCTVTELPLLSKEEQKQITVEWNATKKEYGPACIQDFFARQVKRRPEAIAVESNGQRLTYRDLNGRANQLAHYLRSKGVGPEVLVGICTERNLHMIVGLLGILKAGGAYVPLDPEYPSDRIAFMLEDSRAPILLTQATLRGKLPHYNGSIVELDQDWQQIGYASAEDTASVTLPGNPAYVIYTSGSTGQPKGVVITHDSAVNFLHSMDSALGDASPGQWIAVTSMCFDISVLELFWTLGHGDHVIIHPGLLNLQSISPAPRKQMRPIDFSLFFFAAAANQGGASYKLLLDSARFADQNGFSAVWTPERHFHSFGGLYPNPAVTGAAVAAVTSNIEIRAGSVVLPLHDPLRVAEEWSVVDGISGGRVAVSFASGWNPNDFVLSPERFVPRKQTMMDAIQTVRALWRGESISRRNGAGQEVSIRIYPSPVQKELSIWLTAAGSPETFRAAGEMGAKLLTHLLGQDISELGEKIAMYRSAYRAAGHHGEGHVAVMLHTFIGSDLESTRALVYGPFCRYLEESLDLVNIVPRSGSRGAIQNIDVTDREALLSHAFERYFEGSSLMGDEATCTAMLHRLAEIDVDEVACLIDFGIHVDAVMQSLQRLLKLKTAWDETVHYHEGILEWTDKDLQCTPTFAVAMLDQWRSGSKLRRVLVGGEAFPETLADELLHVVREGVYNMYGPTETTVWSSMHRLDGTSGAVPIGQPIGNTQIYVVDDHLKPVPPGVTGHIYIAGSGLARGYLTRPDLTAEKFLPNPFSREGGARFYDTGDSGRWTAGGQLEYVGRSDDQIKLRGYRIELGEVRVALESHPSIRQAVAIVQNSQQGEKQVVAYAVCEPGSQPAQSAVLAFLRGKLPQYMLPNLVVFVDELPLTPNGKIDRKALQRLPAVVLPKPYVAPVTSTQEKVVEVWKELLKAERVGIQDDFFELGGHSLLAMRVIVRLEETFGVAIPVRVLFERRTIAELSEWIDANSNKPEPQTSAVIQRVSRDHELPVSFNQEQRLVLQWLAQLRSERSVPFNVTLPLRFSGNLDRVALERALQEMVHRHEALRTGFSNMKGVLSAKVVARTLAKLLPLVLKLASFKGIQQKVRAVTSKGGSKSRFFHQSILPAAAVKVEFTDLAEFPIEAREPELRRMAGAEIERPFVLSRPPLMHLRLFRLAPDEHVLVMVISHLICDGWSLNILRRELTALYRGFSTDQGAHLPELKVQFADFASWQRDWFKEKVLEEHIAYWKQQLPGFSTVHSPFHVGELPFALQPPDSPTYRAATRSITVDPDLHRALHRFCSERGVTLYMVLLAAFNVLLRCYTGKERICLWANFANRTRPEVQDVVGWFSQSHMLSMVFSGDPGFIDVLEHARNVVLGAYSHQEIPISLLWTALGQKFEMPKKIVESPHIAFDLQVEKENAANGTANPVNDLVITHEALGNAVTKLGLWIIAVEQPNAVKILTQYAVDWFNQEDVTEMLEQLLTLLKCGMDNPFTPISQLQLRSIIGQRSFSKHA